MSNLETFRMTIGGKPVDALSGATFESQNPYTGASWAVVPDGRPEDVDAAVAAARVALDGEWGACTGFVRAALMRRLAGLITDNAENGIADYTETKSVWVELSGGTRDPLTLG